ncbi:MAG: hypothetical protein HY898_35025 [Deltaproteobacteria bacterium]|nr:hypothetical protein [Deltaproteobacteria bacterium]
MREQLVSIEWQPRLVPLDPCAAAACGAAALALARRLQAEPAEKLTLLRGVAGADVLAVCGAPENLPWVDGVVYLGIDPAAPRLRLPTCLRPSVPVDLIERAILRLSGAATGAPLAVLCAEPLCIIPLAAALPVMHARLATTMGLHL